MRDDRNFTKTESIVTRRLDTGTTNTATNVRQVTYSRRDDVTPTEPVGGVFIRPTNYYACFAYSSSSQITPGRFRDSVWPHKGNYRSYEVTASGYSDGGAVKHGLQPGGYEPHIPAECLSRGRERLRAAVAASDFNAGQSLAELRESIQTIGSLLRGGRGLYRALQNSIQRNAFPFKSPIVAARQHGSLRSIRHWANDARDARRLADARRLSNLADAWLSWMYGIKPILNDIFAILEIIAGEDRKPRWFIDIDQPDDSFELPKSDLVTFRDVYKGTVKRGVRLRAVFVLEDPFIFNLWRYGLTNPLAIAWELIPLSFVFDWFIHLGGFLQGLQRPLGVRFEDGYETKYLKNRFVREVVTTPLPLQTRIVDQVGRVQVNIRSDAMRREPLYRPLPPIPYVSMDLGVGQVLSLIALYVQNTR